MHLQYIQPKSDLCELHEVKVFRSIDPVATYEEKVTVNQHRTSEPEDSADEALTSGMKREGSNLTSERQKNYRISLEMEEHLFNRNIGSWKLRSCTTLNQFK